MSLQSVLKKFNHKVCAITVIFPDPLKNKRFEKLCILDIDLFHFLVALVMSLPSLHMDTTKTPLSCSVLPFGGLNDQHALHLVMAVHLIQVLLMFDEENCGRFPE